MTKDTKIEFTNKVVLELIDLYQPIAALNYFNYLSGWDTETYMPASGIYGRSKATSLLALEIQAKYLSKEFQDCLKTANKQKKLNDFEKSILKTVSYTSDCYTKLPVAFVKEFSEVVTKASTIWAEARKNESVAEFLPVLEQIFALTKQKAEYLGYETDPYEAIFAEYELGMSPQVLDDYMREIKDFLLTIDLNSVNFPKSDLFTDKSYNVSKMEETNYKVLMFLGFDPSRFRLDISTHPFSLFLTADDIRLTTRYPEFDFSSSFMPVIHEYGHGFFSSNVDRQLATTPLWPETSYALHESQSRFWENILGRSRGFLVNFMDEFQEVHLGISKFDFNIDDVWNYLNRVNPSLVRVDADEISYHWHIIIRYELEKDILNGKLAVKDIEKAWNNKYQEYLGITPPRPSLGVLQDIHWSFGSIGYFPTYSMGTATAAMIREKLLQDIDLDFNSRIDISKMHEMNVWFKENIHQYAGAYSLEDVWERLAGTKLSAKPWIKYIKEKYQIT